MTRREFIALLGGAAAWPLAARAQQGDRVRRIGMLLPLDENDPIQKTAFSAFTQALADLGWTVGRNVRIDPRWGGVDINRIRALAQELVGLQPDVIVTVGSTPAIAAVQRETRTIPIVFANVLTGRSRPCPPMVIALKPLRFLLRFGRLQLDLTNDLLRSEVDRNADQLLVIGRLVCVRSGYRDLSQFSDRLDSRSGRRSRVIHDPAEHIGTADEQVRGLLLRSLAIADSTFLCRPDGSL
jgi:hypothetical protein